jgi:hypothetical protein
MNVRGMLNWAFVKVLALMQAQDCRDYAQYVHGGPAPVDWKIREGIPPHSQWPKRADGSLKLFVGAQRHGRVRPVRAENLVTGGNRVGACIPTPEIDAAWGNDDWLHTDEDEQ